MDFNATQVENCSNQIIYKIINSTVIDYPYPHAETLGILPNDLLDEIKKNFPDKPIERKLLQLSIMLRSKK